MENVAELRIRTKYSDGTEIMTILTDLCYVCRSHLRLCFSRLRVRPDSTSLFVSSLRDILSKLYLLKVVRASFIENKLN